MSLAHRLEPLVATLLIAASLAGCTVVAGAIPKGGPIAQSVAETYARLGSGMSFSSVDVVGSRLSTYGAERPGGTQRAATAQVWAVTLSGLFLYGSCLNPISAFGSAPPSKPCRSPAPRERVLVDAGSGLVVEVLPGG